MTAPTSDEVDVLCDRLTEAGLGYAARSVRLAVRRSRLPFTVGVNRGSVLIKRDGQALVAVVDDGAGGERIIRSTGEVTEDLNPRRSVRLSPEDWATAAKYGPPSEVLRTALREYFANHPLPG